MYRCFCCNATFDTPWAKLPRYVSRYSEEYGDRAIMCCPKCGEENYMECDEENYEDKEEQS